MFIFQGEKNGLKKIHSPTDYVRNDPRKEEPLAEKYLPDEQEPGIPRKIKN